MDVSSQKAWLIYLRMRNKMHAVFTCLTNRLCSLHWLALAEKTASSHTFFAVFVFVFDFHARVSAEKSDIGRQSYSELAYNCIHLEATFYPSYKVPYRALRAPTKLCVTASSQQDYYRSAMFTGCLAGSSRFFGRGRQGGKVDRAGGSLVLTGLAV